MARGALAATLVFACLVGPRVDNVVDALHDAAQDQFLVETQYPDGAVRTALMQKVKGVPHRYAVLKVLQPIAYESHIQKSSWTELVSADLVPPL